MWTLYKNKYIDEINRFKLGQISFREDQIYERLWALESRHVLWDDIPPGFEKMHDLPHLMDYGIDTINLEYTQTGQVKFYGPNSKITYSDISNFHTYSTGILKIDNMKIFTTPEAKIDKMVLRLFRDEKEAILRRSYDELLQNVPQSIIYEDDCVCSQIEQRSYLVNITNLILQNNEKEEIKVQMPCGLGKSYLAFNLFLQHKETLKDDEIFLFITPWRSLGRQILKECEFLRIDACLIGDGKKKIPKTAKFIICIYKSMEILPKNLNIKYKFGDEAHHLENSGAEAKVFNEIPAQKTILLSATFKNTKEVDYMVSKREGIDTGYLPDYKLVFQFFTGKRQDALLKMIVENAEYFPVFIYFNSIEKTKAFCSLLQEHHVSADYLIGTDSEQKRLKIRENIKNGILNVVCLSGCWNEGESVPELKTVIFGDLRFSPINVRQVSQRGSRKHPSKPFYNIVLPLEKNVLNIDIDEDEDNEYLDYKNLLKIFTDEDMELKKAVENKYNSQIVLRLNNNKICEKDEEENGILLFQRVYNSFNEIVLDTRLSAEQKVNILLQDGKIYSTTDKTATFSDGCLKGKLWNNCKTFLRCEKLPYIKLLENPLFSQDYERYKLEREKKKDVVKLSPKEKVEILLQENKIYSDGDKTATFSDGSSKGIFWNNCKTFLRCEKLPYIKLLENQLYSQDYERYKKEKENKKGIIFLSVEEKIEILLQDNKIYSKADKTATFSDGCLKGQFWSDCKKDLRCEKEPYLKLLENLLFSQDYERYKKEKEKKKDVVKLSQEEKVEILLQENKIYSQRDKTALFSDGCLKGKFWSHCKNDFKCQKMPYSKLLENPLYKEDYEKFKANKN